MQIAGVCVERGHLCGTGSDDAWVSVTDMGHIVHEVEVSLAVYVIKVSTFTADYLYRCAEVEAEIAREHRGASITNHISGRVRMRISSRRDAKCKVGVGGDAAPK